ncbi:hypothetical protein [Natrinema salsiterrestre]|uniref:Uncharacterized protein n=1 Tax=Natrinema salsiterrestre TaxID=2950540 RepID=A0A9Q4L6A2_9EURY|nr:hypothetical protein [Natrinema salsiterrestre]MDF9748387.1 hypothetical protein [Natrinema salsiterrestre]
MKQFRDIPFETRPSDKRNYELFEEEIWTSSEICNSCFAQVRSIGPAKEKMLETPDEKCLEHGKPVTLTLFEWYERTENGSQEHTTWDANRRFGTCYCLNCGTDCNGNHRNKSLEELKPLAKNIFRYVKRHTDHDIDGKTFGRQVRQLKSRRDAQGNETEVLGIAFARALDRDRPATDAGRSSTPVAVSD